jgi:hypothetical protein
MPTMVNNLQRKLGWLTIALAITIIGCSHSGSSGTNNTAAADASKMKITPVKGYTGTHFVQNTGKSIVHPPAAAEVVPPDKKLTLQLPKVPSLWGVKDKTELLPANPVANK